MIEYITKRALGIPPQNSIDRTLDRVDKIDITKSAERVYELITSPVSNYIAKRALGIKR